ncbi:MAG: RlmE family RNA methyltransferase, partial [Methanoregula sp.]|jgi:23S rRNA (uridine2552-2'-O)-methyltransferase
MGSQWSRDKVYLRAKQEGFRSRASYKLIEIQEKFAIIRRDDNIIDLGAAPGSWLQVLRTLTDGKVLGIDLNPIADLEGTLSIEGDLTDTAIQKQAQEMLGTVSVVVCDAAPKLSGHRSYDQARAIALGEEALVFACQVLKPGGNFVIKSFQGVDFPELLAQIREHFYVVKNYSTKATRKGSTEIYIIGKNFKG